MLLGARCPHPPADNDDSQAKPTHRSHQDGARFGHNLEIVSCNVAGYRIGLARPQVASDLKTHLIVAWSSEAPVVVLVSAGQVIDRVEPLRCG